MKPQTLCLMLACAAMTACSNQGTVVPDTRNLSVMSCEQLEATKISHEANRGVKSGQSYSGSVRAVAGLASAVIGNPIPGAAAVAASEIGQDVEESRLREEWQERYQEIITAGVRLGCW